LGDPLACESRYANDVDHFNRALLKLKTEFPEQTALITYFQEQMLPTTEQWAQCFISGLPNFGSRTTSPAEVAHKDIKAEIINGNSTIEQLVLAVQRMVSRTEKRFTEESARQQSAVAFELLGQKWLGDVPKQVSYKALALIKKQYLLAQPAVPTAAQPFPPSLRPCTGRHRIQYGLPCSHEICDSLEDQKPLRKEDCHRY
jgi:hypothetical protein